MPYQLGLPAALARFGLTVETVPGWQTRGSSTFAPRGAVAHWTAGPRGTTTRPSLNVVVNGRTGLAGPLANVYLDRKGIAVVVAAGRANHAGVGGWRGLTGNSQVFGTEAECGGDGDWTALQRWAYPRVNAAYCWLGKFAPDMVCGHNEWAPTRKIDIRDWPMPSMRTQVAQLLAAQTQPAAQEDDDMTPAQARLLWLIGRQLGLDQTPDGKENWPGWAQLGGKTVVDALAEMRDDINKIQAKLGA